MLLIQALLLIGLWGLTRWFFADSTYSDGIYRPSPRARLWQHRKRTAHRHRSPLLWFAGKCWPQSRLYWATLWPIQVVAIRAEHLRIGLWEAIRFEALALEWLVFRPVVWSRFGELAQVSILAWAFWHLGFARVRGLSLEDWLRDRALLAPVGVSGLRSSINWYRAALDARRHMRRARSRYYRHARAELGGLNPPPFPSNFYGQVFDLNGAVKNVKNPAYGLMGDASTDDATKLQALIDATPAAGAWIFFPDGTFMIGTSINPQGTASANIGPLWYCGAGMGATILMPTAANTAQILIATSNAKKITDMGWENITFDGNVANRASGNVLVQPRGMNIRFRRVRFQNATDWNAKVFQATSIGAIDTFNHRTMNVRVTDCEMFSSGDGWTINACDNVQVAFNWGYGNGHNMIDINSSRAGVIANNLGEWCGGPAALSAEGEGLLIFSNNTNGSIKDIAVTGNTFRNNGQSQYGTTTGTSRDGIRVSDDGTATVTGVVVTGNRCYDDFASVAFVDTLKTAITTAPAAGTVETWAIPNLPFLWPFTGTFSILIGTEVLRVIGGQGAGGSWMVLRGDNSTTPATHTLGAGITGVQMQGWGVRAAMTTAGGDVLVQGNIVRGNRIGGINGLTGMANVIFRDNPGYNPTGSAAATPAVATPTTNTTGVDCQVSFIANASGTTITVDGKALGVTPANAWGHFILQQGSAVSYNNAPASWNWSGL